jgi:hypothetical protein
MARIEREIDVEHPVLDICHQGKSKYEEEQRTWKQHWEIANENLLKCQRECDDLPTEIGQLQISRKILQDQIDDSRDLKNIL